jgi:protein-ribulosamine 3-kinase
MIPGEVVKEIESRLSVITGSTTVIKQSTPVSGGCINFCFHLNTSAGEYFLKYNDASAYPNMFRAEASGLQLLRDANALPIPFVHFHGEVKRYSFLLMEWIDGDRQKKNFWEDFGRAIAKLHNVSDASFGLDHDNYIGSLEQSNFKHTHWKSFFIVERIQPQLKLAMEKNLVDKGTVKQFEKLFDQFDNLIPEEKPALLHGDLWNGNFLVSNSGRASLIDPAVYFGHREMDLAMTKLFGGFDPEFYHAYEEAFPLEKGFEKRVDIHNLYPLLVHVNLFGGGYMEQIKASLNNLKM